MSLLEPSSALQQCSALEQIKARPTLACISRTCFPSSPEWYTKHHRQFKGVELHAQFPVSCCTTISSCTNRICCHDAGLMTLLGVCGVSGPITFLLALIAAILVITFPGKDPHQYACDSKEEPVPGLQYWASPGVRIPCMIAAQVKIWVIAFRCFWQIWRLQATPGQFPRIPKSASVLPLCRVSPHCIAGPDLINKGTIRWQLHPQPWAFVFSKRAPDVVRCRHVPCVNVSNQNGTS